MNTIGNIRIYKSITYKTLARAVQATGFSEATPCWFRMWNRNRLKKWSRWLNNLNYF